MVAGNVIEKRAKLYLIRHGEVVDQAKSTLRWIFDRRIRKMRPISQKVDLFGVFDLVSLRPRLLVRCVQTTTMANRSHRKAKVRAFIERNQDLLRPSFPGSTPNGSIEVWAWGKWKNKHSTDGRATYGFVIDTWNVEKWDWDESFLPSSEVPLPSSKSVRALSAVGLRSSVEATP
jgi:hypothetical protein